MLKVRKIRQLLFLGISISFVFTLSLCMLVIMNGNKDITMESDGQNIPIYNVHNYIQVENDDASETKISHLDKGNKSNTDIQSSLQNDDIDELGILFSKLSKNYFVGKRKVNVNIENAKKDNSSSLENLNFRNVTETAKIIRNIEIADKFVNDSHLKFYSPKLFKMILEIMNKYKHTCYNQMVETYFKEQIIKVKYYKTIIRHLNLPDHYFNSTLPVQTVQTSEKLIICDNRPLQHADENLLVLFTTMYHKKDKQFMFLNTVKNWASLGSKRSKIHVILYISDLDTVEHSGVIISKACSAGWTVAFAPHCNRDSYPLLNSMFTHSKLIAKAKWYGFCNADILFDDGLLKTMQFFNRIRERLTVHFAAARRRNAYLSPDMEIETLADVHALKNQSSLYMSMAIDLFIFHKDMVPISDMPPFVIGRPGYDNWMMHYAATQNKTAIDITDSVTLIHQGMRGYDEEENSHHTEKKSADFNIKLVLDWNDVMQGGSILCIPHYTSEKQTANNDTNKHMISAKLTVDENENVSRHVSSFKKDKLNDNGLNSISSIGSDRININGITQILSNGLSKSNNTDQHTVKLSLFLRLTNRQCLFRKVKNSLRNGVKNRRRKVYLNDMFIKLY